MVMLGLFQHTKKSAAASSVVVIGLGRFGRSVALELEANGTEVLGIDNDSGIVNSLDGSLTQVVRADATSKKALEQLGVGNYERVVLAISGLETSLMCALHLARMGGLKVWAKASSEEHAQILAQIGTTKIVQPEVDMGRRVAHMVRRSITDYVQLDENTALVSRIVAPQWVGRTLEEVDQVAEAKVGIVALRRADGQWIRARGRTLLCENDTIVVLGPVEEAESFCE